MRRLVISALAFGVLSLPACEKKETPSPALTDGGSQAAPRASSSNPEPTVQNTETASDAPSETSEQITQRLLESSFRQPPGVEVRQGTPPISLTPELVDLGDVPPHTSVSGSLTMTNISDEPLRILALKSTCACTVPGIESDIIEPNQSITVVLELDSKSVTGSNQRYVMAMFEGYRQPVQLIVQADVNYGIRTTVNFDEPGNSRLADIVLTSTDESVPFSVLSAGGRAPVFTDGFDPVTDEPRTRYTIRQDLSSFSAELLPRWFIIETDHPTSPIVDVVVTNNEIPPVRVRHRFNISEERFVFGYMEPGKTSEGKFRVVGGDLPDASEFVQSIEWTNTEQCDVEIISATNDQGGIEIVVGVTPKNDITGVVHGTVTLRAMDESKSFDIIGRVAPEK